MKKFIVFAFSVASTLLSAQSVTGQLSFTNRLGSVVLNYPQGDTLRAKVVDADRNLSSTALDTLSVRFSSEKETSGEKITFTETGVNTGVFTGSMLFSETTAVASDGILQVNRGNKLTGTYVDPADDFGNTTALTATSYYGLTLVTSGTLTANTTWTQANSPYLLTGDVIVPQGKTLTIEPGVEIRIKAITDDLSSGDDVNRIEIRVEGQLSAKGTAQDSIRFVSNAQIPAAGDWYGIVSYGSYSGKVTLKYCRLNNYVRGLYVTGSGQDAWQTGYVNTDTLSITRTVFYGGGDALRTEWASYHPIVFTHNKVYGAGIYDMIQSSYKNYQYNSFLGTTTSKSIEFRGRNNDWQNGVKKPLIAEFKNNTVQNGRVTMWLDSYRASSRINITDNIFTEKGANNTNSWETDITVGFSNQNYDSYHIDSNVVTVSNNRSDAATGAYIYGNGISIQTYSSPTRVKVHSNKLHAVGGIRLYSEKNSIASVKNNDIDSSYYEGLNLERVSGIIQGNEINKAGRWGNYGIRLYSDFNHPSIDTLRYNTITNSGYWDNPTSTTTSPDRGGLKIEGYTQVVANYNNFVDNNSFEIVNNVAAGSVSQQNAKFNYWGTSTTAQIATGGNPKNLTKIYDQYDLSSLGFVNYGGNLNAAYPTGVPSSITTSGQLTFVNRLGSVVLNYPQGDTLRAKVVDADRNLSSTALDTLSVRFSSEKETSGEKITFTETGVNTGVFTGSMLFSETTAVASDGILQVNRGNKLTGTYVDPADDFGNTTALTATSYYGLTLVTSGTLTANTTWTQANSPYLLTGDVIVPQGKTLTIEPGVEIRIKAITDDLSSGDDVNRIEIRVEGQLSAKGTAQDSIRFVSNAQIPAAGDWYGIVSYGSYSGKVTLKYCRLNNYVRGLYVTGSGQDAWQTGYVNTDTLSITRTVFYGGGDALRTEWASYHPIVFTHNKVYGAGIYDMIQSSYKNYQYNSFLGTTTSKSIEFRGRNNDWQNGVKKPLIAEFKNNTVQNGRVTMWLDSYRASSRINITDNIFTEKGANNTNSWETDITVGFSNQNYDSYHIDSNVVTVSNNRSDAATGAYIYGNGISIQTYSSPTRVKVHSNKLHAVGGIRLYSEKNSIASVKNNDIDSSYYEGLNLERVSGIIQGNEINKAGRWGNYGIRLYSDFNYPSIDTLRYNTITNSGYWDNPTSTTTSPDRGGLKIEGYTQVVANYNNFVDNNSFEIVNNVAAGSVSQQNAKFNYWGTSTTAQIATGGNPKNLTKIYDQYDLSSLGFVNYGGNLNAAYPTGVPSSITTSGQLTFVNRLGSVVLNYPQGDTLRAKVVDADRNLSSTALDTLSVRFSSEKETSGEKITFTETGVNTGVFTGSMLFSETTAVASDGILQVNRGNKLTGTYVDPADDFGNTTALTATSYYGLTLVTSGTLTANTTWTQANSPYLLTGDVIVPQGKTLTIEPGVEIRIKAITDDLSSGDDVNRIEIRVEGQLSAKGTAQDSIRFVSNAQIPAAGDWYGIVSYGSYSGKVTLKYCRLNNYVRGLYVTGSGQDAWQTGYVNTDTLSITRTVFYGGGDALRTEWASYHPIVFTHNKVYGAGIYDMIQSSYKNYQYNSFLGTTTSKSIEFRGRNNDWQNGVKKPLIAEFKNNTVQNGRVTMWLDSYRASSRINITDNIFTEKGANNTNSWETDITVGFSNQNYDSYHIDSNVVTVSNNRSDAATGAYIYGNGISIQTYSSPTRVKVHSNKLHAVGGIRLYSEKNSIASVKNNDIDSSYYEGLNLERVSGIIQGNEINKAGRWGNYGIRLYSDFNHPSIDTLRYNTITNSGYWDNPTSTTTSPDRGGLKIEGYTQVVANYNNFVDNNSFEIVNNVAAGSVSQQNAKFNYWGTSTTAQIATGGNPKNLTKIYDQYDLSSLGFVNYGQNQTSFIFDEIPDTIYYGGDSVLIQTQNGKVGNWSNGVTNSNQVELNGYSGEIVFSWTFGSNTYTDTATVINLTKIYVSPTGSDLNSGRLSAPFKTIQAAVNASDNLDSIYVYSGTYDHFQIRSQNYTGRNYVIGYGPSKPIIDGGNSARCIEIIDTKTTLENLSLRNGYAPPTFNGYRGALLYGQYDSIWVKNCDFKNGFASQGGDYYGGGAKATFINCQFFKNETSLTNNKWSTFFVDNGHWAEFYNCLIDADGYQSVFTTSQTYKVYNSTIVNLSGRLNGEAYQNHEFVFVNNIVTGSGSNMHVFPDTTYTLGHWGGSLYFENNRLPELSTSYVYGAAGGQLTVVNCDTLPILFTNAAAGDYTLQNADVHHNIGSLSYTYYADALGNARPDVNYRVDYGAYESDYIDWDSTSIDIQFSKADVLCYSGATGSATAHAVGGTKPYAYSWNTIPVQTSKTATGLSAGQYIVTVTDSLGVSASDTVEILQPSETILELTSISDTVNPGESVVIVSNYAQAGSIFWPTFSQSQWSGNGRADMPGFLYTITPSNGQWVSLTRTLQSGCTVKDSIQFFVRSGVARTQNATIYVDGASGSDANTGTLSSPVETIQKAIEKAIAGDTIQVAAGIYDHIIIDKALTVRGSGNHLTTITGHDTTRCVVILNHGDDQYFENLNLFNGYADGAGESYRGGAIWHWWVNKVIATNVDFKNCVATQASDYVKGGSNIERTFINCKFLGNHTSTNTNVAFHEHKQNFYNCFIDASGYEYVFMGGEYQVYNTTVVNAPRFVFGEYNWMPKFKMVNSIVTKKPGTTQFQFATNSSVNSNWDNYWSDSSFVSNSIIPDSLWSQSSGNNKHFVVGAGMQYRPALFADTANGDYHLSIYDAGLNVGVTNIPLYNDPDGHARPDINGYVDLGAYETNDFFVPCNPALFTSDFLPDSIIYGGDTLEVSANFGVSGTWSHDNSFGSHVTLLGYEGPIVFSHTNPMGCTLTDTTYVINLDTLYVSTSGSDNNDGRITHPYATIQAAVDASDEDDVILVNPGAYGPFSITWKEIMVSGMDPNNRPTITGYDSLRCIELNGNGIELKYLSLRNGFAPVTQNWNRGGLLFGGYDSVTVTSCDFKDGVGLQGGDYYGGGGRITFINCEFLANTKQLSDLHYRDMFHVDNGLWMNMYNSFIDAKGFGRIFGPGNTYRMYNSTVVNLSGRIFQHPAPGQEVKLVNNIIVAYPGSNYQIMPDTGYVWSSAAGPMLFKNNRLPDNLSTYTYASGAQVVFTNNDTLPVFFVDSANGDYRLSLLDDHHNLGDTSVTLYTDMNGHARPDVNGYVDYGAFESDATRCDQNQSQVQASYTVRANSNVSMSVTGRNLVSYLWSNGDTTATTSVYPHTPTTYWVSALDADGCTVSDTLTIQTVDVTFRVDLRNQVLSTNGVHVAGTWNAWQSNVDSLLDGNGDLIYETTIGLVVGDTVQYKFINGNSWSDPCDQLPPSCGVSQPFGNRYYEVTVADTLTAVYLSSCDENQPIDPLVDVLPTKCIGTSVDLSAGTDVTNVLWNTGDTTNTISVTAPGKYYFSAIYPNGVIVSDTTVVSNQPVIPSTIGVTSVTGNNELEIGLGSVVSVCEGEQVMFYNFMSGSAYTWSSGDTGAFMITSTPGSYYSLVQNTYGCWDTTNAFTLVNYANPDTSVTVNGNMVYCQGSSVTLSAASGQSYLWNTGDTTQSITATQAGSYYAVVTTSNGCSDTTATYTTSLYADPDLTVTASGSLDFCLGSSVTLSAASGQSYMWNTGDTTQSITATQAGSYYAVVTTSNGCSDTTATYTTSLYADPDLTVTASGSLDFCLGSSVTLSAASGQSYLWNTGDTTQSITATQAGSYYAVVTTSNGCSDTTATYTTSLYADPDLTVTASGSLDFCLGSSVTLSAASGQSYMWNTGDTTQSITATQAGSYYAVVTTSNGCSDTTATYTTSLYADPDLTVTASGSLDFCLGSSVTLSAASGQSYMWNTGDTTQSITATQAGSYYAVVTTSNGCSDTTATYTTSLYADPDLTVTASGSLDFCLGSSVTLSAASGQSYMWNTGDTTQSITATQAGSYYAVVTTSNGCSDTTATYTTSLYADPDKSVSVSQTVICVSGSATIAAHGGYTYLWNTGDTTQSVTVNLAGSYYAMLTDSNGCSATSDTTMITVVPDIVLPQITSNGLGWVITGSTTGFSVPMDTNYTYQWGIQGGSIQFGQGTDSIAVLWGIPDSNVAVWVVISNGVCSDSVGISINISGIGTDERALQNVRLFPNPNDGYFTIEVGEAFVGASYEIVDGMGRPIERGEIQSQTQAFDLADKPKGVYRIALTKNDKRKTLMVVIQ